MKKDNVAMYLRLSREDGLDESSSISSQREFLGGYIKKRGWTLYKEYIDDGYTGTNFNRPGFNEMVDDMEHGYVNILLIKDLSRLGRNYIYVGTLLEEYFPQKGIRVVAVNDNYDSETSEDDFIPLRNVFNEFYAKDTSKKIRSVLNNKAKNGESRRTVVPLYGFRFDENNQKVEDPETAPIVRLIFNLFLEFCSIQKVVDYLREHKIKTPKYYNAMKYGYKRFDVMELDKSEWYVWSKNTVRDILKNEEYIGTYTTAKTKSISFKIKKRIKNKEAYVFENYHVAIVDKDIFERVQKVLNMAKGSSVPVAENIFKGVIFCKDCGSPLRFERRTTPKGKVSFTYYCTHKDCKHTNIISVEKLKELIGKEMERIINKFICSDVDINFLSNILAEKEFTEKSDIMKLLEEYRELKDKKEDFIDKLFMEHFKGIIPTNMLKSISEKRRKELEVIYDQIANYEKILDDFNKGYSKEKYIEDLKIILTKLRGDELLNPKILFGFISKISVRTRPIGNSRKDKDIRIFIEYKKINGLNEKCTILQQ